MAYTDPTPANLKARYPVFASVPDPIVQAAIDEAKRRVDTTWTEGDYTNAVMLLACHFLALEGYGGSGSGGGGNAAYRQIRSGQLTLTRYASGEANGDDGSLLGSTMYGRRWLELLSLNKPGIKVIAGDAHLVSGYAKDWPL